MFVVVPLLRLLNCPPVIGHFVIVNLFDSIEVVRAFAGPDYSTPVFEPEARLLLSRVEPIAHHYEVREDTVRTSGK